MSTSSLHQLIAACSIKSKSTNYLIWRTQISQLIQVMKLTYLIYEPSKSSCSTGQTVGKVVKVMKDAKDSGTIDDWKEKDVLLRSWISSTLTEENMYLIVGCSTAKKVWECLEKADIQATKIINFARDLGLKYKTFVILGKTPNSTLNQFVYTLTSFDIREDEEKVSQQNHNMDGTLPAHYMDKGFGEGLGAISLRNIWVHSNLEVTLATMKLPIQICWNRIMVEYCGGAFTGDVESVDPVSIMSPFDIVQATNLHFRGARIFSAVMEDLFSKGLKDAKNALLIGNSAGAYPAMLYCDRFSKLLPNTPRIKCLTNSGYFVNV
ncbi:hypothetical protein KY290_033507 [Solanum tuberosum]|uniref:Pectin acetylesterase n=1 Tax=Solanum tuberosum TaxID=4113 RepID=A0ABQ7U2D0_SOLTU|nr:hypothetical protein KY285_032758 [Solanum tuberosum]KAH0740464.1 hypothetical protein KY290_033507 [Solanum tuberosum]